VQAASPCGKSSASRPASIITIAVGVDLIWTTLRTHGGGPVSDTLRNGSGNFFCVCIGVVRCIAGSANAGPVLLVLIVAIWIGLFWAGCFLVFEGRRDSVVDSHSRRTATTEEKFFFAGATLFTFGTSEYADGWDWDDVRKA
jgi:hypothetical protein